MLSPQDFHHLSQKILAHLLVQEGNGHSATKNVVWLLSHFVSCRVRNFGAEEREVRVDSLVCASHSFLFVLLSNFYDSQRAGSVSMHKVLGYVPWQISRQHQVVLVLVKQLLVWQYKSSDRFYFAVAPYQVKFLCLRLFMLRHYCLLVVRKNQVNCFFTHYSK